jgi:aspartate kinase
VTDENCREAAVYLEKTKEKITESMLPHIEQGIVPIIAGFAGRSETGRVTILGRGGSDDTAACIAYCLEADQVIKYVSEEGIMTIDPKFLEIVKEENHEIYERLGGLPQPEVIPYLSYIEASELLREERTKVVHYKVLNPLMKGNILLHITNFSKPDSSGTVIGPEDGDNGSAHSGLKAISFQRGLYGIRFMPTQSLTPTEVYARVFDALSKEGVDIRYLSTSGYQISLLMPLPDIGKALDALAGLDVAMEISSIDGRKGTFSVIGSGMRGVKGLFSMITGTLATYGVNIEQAKQPNSENIIRFSIDDNDIPMAVSALYNEFFNGGNKNV